MSIPLKVNKLKAAIHKANSANDAVENLEREIYRETIERDIEVSDHALVRWLERVHKIDIEALKRKMLTEEEKAWINQGATRIKRGNGHIIANNGKVVTVIA